MSSHRRPHPNSPTKRVVLVAVLAVLGVGLLLGSTQMPAWKVSGLATWSQILTFPVELAALGLTVREVRRSRTQNRTAPILTGGPPSPAELAPSSHAAIPMLAIATVPIVVALFIFGSNWGATTYRKAAAAPSIPATKSPTPSVTPSTTTPAQAASLSPQQNPPSKSASDPPKSPLVLPRTIYETVTSGMVRDKLTPGKNPSIEVIDPDAIPAESVFILIQNKDQNSWFAHDCDRRGDSDQFECTNVILGNTPGDPGTWKSRAIAVSEHGAGRIKNQPSGTIPSNFIEWLDGDLYGASNQLPLIRDKP